MLNFDLTNWYYVGDPCYVEELAAIFKNLNWLDNPSKEWDTKDSLSRINYLGRILYIPFSITPDIVEKDISLEELYPEDDDYETETYENSIVSFKTYSPRYSYEYITHLGVDSGQLSVIPLTQFIGKEWDEKRYLQLSFENEDGFLEDMFVTGTDYGDGQYGLYVRYNKDNNISGFYMEL